ncbi:telomere length regulation protein [Blastocladiella emersonii ATCC 22665]|nr:telomere length regulation protein [Blastocladiella emersonii ATCC 22665]
MNALRVAAAARGFSTSASALAQAATTTAAKATRTVPPPRGKVTDVKSFLYYIGRNSDAVEPKIKSWDALFTSTSEEFKAMGLNPRQRKYVLLWAERFRQGRDLHVIKNSGKRK